MVQNGKPSSTLNVRYDGPIQIIEFNYPKKRNAITTESYPMLISCLEEAALRDDICITVFTGVGSFYSSGNDFSSIQLMDGDIEDAIAARLAPVKKFIDTLIDHPKLVIAVVNGPAYGVACTTLALMDAVYAHENATFQTPFSELGICPEACSSYLFPRIMGKAAAARMLYFSEKIGAPEALRRGLVTEVYSNIDKEYVWSKIHKIAQLPKQSIMESKKLMSSWDKEFLHNVNNKEAALLQKLFMSEEFLELMTKKFMAKASKL